MIILVVGILIAGLIAVESKKDDSSSSSSTSGSSSSTGSGGDSSEKKDKSSETSSVSKETQTQTFLSNSGEETSISVRIETKEKDGETLQKIKVRNVEASSELEIEGDGEKINAKLSNGDKKEIKVMPDTASERAIEVLQTKGLQIELKEVGDEENKRVVYEVEGNKTVKFLGLFKVRTVLTAVVSAENGEILRFEKPWWYFMAFGKGVVDCNENDLDLCDDDGECSEAGLYWINASCVAGCSEELRICDDNSSVSRLPELECEFEVCPIVNASANETVISSDLHLI